MKDPCFRELYELEAQKLNIAKKIIAYRIENSLTQKGLAERTGITQQQISKIENDEFSSISTLEKALLSIGYSVQLRAVPVAEKCVPVHVREHSASSGGARAGSFKKNSSKKT